VPSDPLVVFTAAELVDPEAAVELIDPEAAVELGVIAVAFDAPVELLLLLHAASNANAAPAIASPPRCLVLMSLSNAVRVLVR
jgi:hypothetical protein